MRLQWNGTASWYCYGTAIGQAWDYHGMPWETMACHGLAIEMTSLHSADLEVSGNSFAKTWGCRRSKGAPRDDVSFVALCLGCR